MRRKVMRTTNILGAAVLGAALVGCAATQPSEQLVAARQTYDETRRSEAAQLTPAKVLEAKQALERAEVAHEENPNSERERTLAYVAQRKSLEAMAAGRQAESQRAQQQYEQQYAELQENLRRRARDELERTRMSLREVEGQLGTIRGELEQHEGTNQELEQLQQQLEAKRSELQQREQELEREREARQKAEQAWRATLASLEEIATVREEERGMVITVSGQVLFRTAESELLPVAEQRLERVAEALRNQPGTNIVIEGHTDSRGDAGMNMELSRDRAESVKNFLVEHGIEPERIRTVGRGEEQPIASNDTAEGRANNRRVEIIIPRQQGGQFQQPGQRGQGAPQGGQFEEPGQRVPQRGGDFEQPGEPGPGAPQGGQFEEPGQRVPQRGGDFEQPGEPGPGAPQEGGRIQE